MNKNNLLDHKFLERSNIALICLLGMIGGFLVSRVLLSLSTMLFGLNALYNVQPRKWFRDKWWVLGIVWVSFYAISSLWSINTGFWNIHFNVKLPILLLPLAFTFMPPLSDRQLGIYTVAVGAMFLLGACYSSMFLVNNVTYYMEQYRVSKVLPTPVDDDHIRFSVSMVLYIVWVLYVWPRLTGRLFKMVIGAIVLLLVIYLHILAAKSGLISLYLFITVGGICLMFSRKFLMGAIVVGTAAVLIFTAIKVVPTFRQRIGYMSYTYIVFVQGDRTGEYGDIGRLISYKVALRQIAAHPWGGVGTGDMMDIMKQGYAKWYPLVKEENQLLPHNQLLDVALGCGIPVAIIFLLWLFYPLTWVTKDRSGFFMFVVWLILFINMMIEPFLEVQFGVFVYLFFLLWQRSSLKQKLPAGISI